MYLLDGAVVTSASDLKSASECGFAFVVSLERKLGWREDPKPERDPLLERVAGLGTAHEARHLAALRAEHPGGVVDIGKVKVWDRADLERAAAATLDALREETPVVYQGVFFDESDPAHPYMGLADFLVRQPDGTYRVVDTKLARRAKVAAVLQLAAYHAQLDRLGVPADDAVEVLLGDGTASTHHIADIAPVYARRRARMLRAIDTHLADARPVTWGDERYAACCRCDECTPEAEQVDDVVRVAGIRLVQRAELRAAGITTATAVARATAVPAGADIPTATFERLAAQARLLVAADAQRAAEPPDGPHAPPPFEVVDPRPVGQLPPPDPGDIFFDFEGDPLWQDDDGGQRTFGLDYLFGWVDAQGRFDCRWAHSLVEEKVALESFLDFLVRRRAQYPGMHVYHYASYERAHLAMLAQRHGTREDEVDQLLRDGVLIDLYPVVLRTVRVGTTSYSIKQLEPLYDEQSRTGVTTAGDSVLRYAESTEAAEAGDLETADEIREEIRAYNEDDCRSTRGLRDWLVSLGAARGVSPGDEPRPEPAEPKDESSDLALDLLACAERAERAERAEHREGPDGVPTGEAYRLAAAAVDYYRRERKAFWWSHFARLAGPAEDWQDSRGVLTVEHVELVRDWHRDHGQRSDRRHLWLRGTWAPGSTTLQPGSARPFLLYPPDSPPYLPARHRPEDRVARAATVLEVEEDGAVLVEELLPADTEPWQVLPSHLTPAEPPGTTNIEAAIAEWVAALARAEPDWPDDAMSALLRRFPPAIPGGLKVSVDADGTTAAVVGSLLAMDRSYLAVQGPPGTGKTYVASHVVTELVRGQRWRIGVVAQSHKVVENVLRAVVEAGLDPDLVGKAPADPKHVPDEPFTWIRKDAQADFAAARAGSGYVLGGTAWDLTNRNRVGVGQLDLVVVEEAGQFSLAATIAVATSARRLLLLGDPQQLPQVSQAVHPAPVDTSALAHLMVGDVLDPAYGYFLAESRRMAAAVSARVSALAYRGELHSHESVASRSLAGVAPGVHPVLVDHTGNATESVEEAAEVVALVRLHLGAEWVEERADGAGLAAPRPLGERDLLVVTPYNAQVEQIRSALDAAGYRDVQVGTVDKFQGREAVVAIVSMAASSPADVPRGMDFLLSRNRLNVSVSRAKWAAYVLYSPALVDYLPRSVAGVADLSRFLGLVAEGGYPRDSASGAGAAAPDPP